jgi:uncharacterized protein
MRYGLTILMLFVGMFIWTSCLRGRMEVSNPKMDERILDKANLFSEQEKDSLFGLIRKLDSEIGSQIGIATTDSLEKGETIEDFSLKAIREMKLGRRNYKDGLLFAISKNDKIVRISVGDGLKQIIPDDKANWINNELIGPRLRDSLYYAGLYTGISYAKKLIEHNREKIGAFEKKE